MQSHSKSGTTFWTRERRNFYLIYLLPFQWIFESIVDNIFAWNNFPCWNEICQLDQYGYHKWMGLNIICYLQHPNQTYIPMSMILWYYMLQKGGMKQLMSRLFILQICNLQILMLLTKYTLESQSNSTQTTHSPSWDSESFQWPPD